MGNDAAAFVDRGGRLGRDERKLPVGLGRVPEVLFRRERDAARAAIEAQGFMAGQDPGGGSYVGAFGED